MVGDLILIFISSAVLVTVFFYFKETGNLNFVGIITTEEAINKIKNYFLSITQPHLKTLSKKREQLVVTDDYGNIDSAKWNNEIDYFIKNTLGFDLDELTLDQQVRFKHLELNWVLIQHIDFYEVLNDFVDSYEDAHSNNKIIFDESMTPIEYEHLCKNLLISYGCNAKVTKGSGDQGVDVIATLGSKKIAIQCKKYSSPVGNKAVQEALAAKQHIGADIAAVVTNNTYTKSAIELSNTTGVMLLHHTELKDIVCLIK